MLTTVASVSLVLCLALAIVSGHHMARDVLIDNTVIIVGIAVEVALIAQLVVALGVSGQIADGATRATFIAYVVTVLVAVPLALLMAIKERSRWGMGVVLGGAITVAILVARILQIWGQHG